MREHHGVKPENIINDCNIIITSLKNGVDLFLSEDFHFTSKITVDVLDEVTLHLSLVNYSPGYDYIDFQFNGSPLLEERFKIMREPHSSGVCHWLQCDVKDALIQGENKLQVFLKRRNPSIAVPLILNDVEATIKYKQNTPK